MTNRGIQLHGPREFRMIGRSRGDVIASFADRTTEALFHGLRDRSIKRIPPQIVLSAARKLDMMRWTVRPKNRVPTHPGEVLLEEFLVPLGVTQVALAEHLEISLQRINEIIRGKRGVSPETAWLFAQAFGTTPEFWLNLQAQHDLARSRPRRVVRKLRKAG